MKKYIFSALVLAGLIYGIGYLILGGGNSTEFTVVQREPLSVYGKHFQGRSNDPELEQIFIEFRNEAIMKGLGLLVINYELDSVKNDIKQFIGVLTPYDKAQHRTGLTLVSLPEGDYLYTELKKHNLVMPKPEQIKSAALEFANRKNLQINTDISYEIYNHERSLEILFKVVED